ncbi:DUF2961 domain-containing protein [Streptomyces cellulosae]
MPFNRRATYRGREPDHPCMQYFYIDYELFTEDLPEDTLYLHAQWRRNNPCDGWAPTCRSTASKPRSPTSTARTTTSSSCVGVIGRVPALPLRSLAAMAALYGRSATAHTSSTNRSPSGARETQGSMAPAARSVAVSRRSR